MSVAFNVSYTRANEPPAFHIPQEAILDPVGLVQVGLREGATGRGNPTVTLIIPVAGGRYAVLETTWGLWRAATKGMEGAIEFWRNNPLKDPEAP